MLSVFCRLQELKKMHTSRQILNLRHKRLFLGIIVSSQSPQLLATRLMPGATICVGLATNSAMLLNARDYLFDNEVRSGC